MKLSLDDHRAALLAEAIKAGKPKIVKLDTTSKKKAPGKPTKQRVVKIKQKAPKKQKPGVEFTGAKKLKVKNAPKPKSTKHAFCDGGNKPPTSLASPMSTPKSVRYVLESGMACGVDVLVEGTVKHSFTCIPSQNLDALTESYRAANVEVNLVENVKSWKTNKPLLRKLVEGHRLAIMGDNVGATGAHTDALNMFIEEGIKGYHKRCGSKPAYTNMLKESFEEICENVGAAWLNTHKAFNSVATFEANGKTETLIVESVKAENTEMSQHLIKEHIISEYGFVDNLEITID